MKHSELVSKLEESISGVIVIGVSRADSIEVLPNTTQITPEIEVAPGKYGLFEIRVLVPMEVKTSV